ncbi:uncharacterized protein MONBRDRAFT_7969 [Monosiga brevicollis MX1]|uniref:Uncharacterized protein n=1 Tax=Monosiga brevicollis TaxID=81824 RepID=A9UYM6_MONBE|nr:uncharacterized protein MONBRDRAFT_7969 [Monosiga brevicollis MX1]EDQ89490.1 predicted protein [Monosiga brevicollis MX1]|eukprot:XP_001745519.1 hypothetical protein [Monosiga brevicollis MX1]
MPFGGIACDGKCPPGNLSKQAATLVINNGPSESKKREHCPSDLLLIIKPWIGVGARLLFIHPCPPVHTVVDKRRPNPWCSHRFLLAYVNHENRYMAFSPCGPRLQAPRVTSPSSTMSRFSFAAAGRRLRIAICGPGLEIPKLDVVSNIMYTGPFRIKGMVSGHQGIGGGVELQHENGRCIELITLYQRPQHERNNPQQAGQARLTHSGLSPAARELLSTIDAFVFAVNASHMLKADASRDNLLFIHQTPAQLTAFEEYSAILGHSNAPVLVLSCQHPGTTTCATPSTGVVDTVEALRLTGESRPWRIEHLPICGARVALRRGFDWLVQAQPS